MRHTITIANIDITSYVFDGYVEKSLSVEISKAELKVRKDVTNILDILTGQEIKITRQYLNNDTMILFRGRIELIRNENSFLILTCFDMLNIAKFAVANMVYLSSDERQGIISEIFKDLLTRYTDLAYSSNSIESSGDLRKLDKFICRNSYVYDRLKALAKTLNWKFWYNPEDGFVYFKPIKYELCTTEINQNNLASLVIFEEDKTELANKITAIGTKIETIRREVFSGNGTKQTFIIQKKPESVKVIVNGVVQRGGKMEDSNVDYYVLKDEKKIVFKVNVPSGTNNVEIEYSFASPVPLLKMNEQSVSLYGEYEKVITLLDVQTIADLEKRLEIFLNIYSMPFVSAKFRFLNSMPNDFKIGKRVKITNLDGVSKTLVIRKLQYNLFAPYDEMEAGDKEFRIENWLAFDVEHRIKKLEEETIREIDLVYNNIQNTHQFSVRRKKLERTINKMNDTFVLGVSTLGGGIKIFEIESLLSFTTSNCTLSLDSNEKIIGQKSIKITKNSGTSSCYIEMDNMNLNISDYVSIESNTIVKGTFDLWFKQATTLITSIRLDLWDNSNNNIYVNGILTPPDTTFSPKADWNYVLFRFYGLTPINFSNIKKIRLSFNFNTANQASIWIDDFTIKKDRYKGTFKLGDRRTLYSIEEIVLG